MNPKKKSPSPSKAYMSFIEKLDIKDIRFTSLNAELTETPWEPQTQSSCSFGLKVENPSYGNKVLLVSLVTHSEVIQNEKPIFIMDFTIAARYSISRAPAKAHLQKFIDTNLIFNLWPFMREAFHATCLRFQITPAPVLPLYKPNAESSKK